MSCKSKEVPNYHYERLDEKYDLSKSVKRYVLNQGFKTHKGYSITEIYCDFENKWKNILINDHPIIGHILNHFKSNYWIDFTEFNKWFDSIDKDHIEIYWKQLLANQILLAEQDLECSIKKKEEMDNVDVYLQKMSTLKLNKH